MKKVIIAILVIVVLIVVALVLLFSNLNSLIAKAIEKNGSNVTQTSVSVSGVDISLREGRGTIKGLRVANPHGFDSRDAFSLDDITLDIDVRSLREETIIIDEIRIKAPVINAEITKTGASNIEKIRDNVKAYTAGSAGGETGGSTRLIKIKQFVFEEGRVEVDVSALGLDNRTVELPEIRLSDVGGAEGAPPDEIARIILAEVAKKVSSEIAGSQVDQLIKEKLGGSVTDKAKGLLDKIKN
jgi:uncharacterized protein involved in outer membrane biogenesis